MRVISHLVMEINEVHNGNILFEVIRTKQIIAIIHATSILSGISVEELTNQFHAMLEKSEKEYGKHTRIIDGTEILKSILNEEEG